MVWYPALPDAPTLPFPTTFNSLEYQPFPLAKTSPGEVPFVDRHFSEQQPKKHATGKHQCGTPEAFLEGIPYDPEAEVAYNDDGLPVCCSAWERGPCGCSAAGAEVEVEPVEGQTCETAIPTPPIPGGGPYVLPYTVGQAEAWCTFEIPVGEEFQVRVIGPGVRRLLSGGDCGSLVQRGNIAGPSPVVFYQASSFGRYWVVWEQPGPDMRIWVPWV